MTTLTASSLVPADLDNDWDHLYDTDPDWALCGQYIRDLPEVNIDQDHLCPMCEAMDELMEELEL